MINEKIRQCNFNTTYIGTIKGAYEFLYDNEIEQSLYYGLSGHAFVLNIVKGICPGSPYVFDKSEVSNLVKNSFGLDMCGNLSDFFDANTDKKIKQQITNDMKRIIDEDGLFHLISLEHQLCKGYENNKFIFTKPWNGMAGSETAEIAFSTFEGSQDFFAYSKIQKVEKNNDIKQNIMDALKYAVNLYENSIVEEKQVTGYKAYNFWISELTEELSVSHGNWWNAMVWSECRYMGSSFLRYIKRYYNDKKILDLLEESADNYTNCAEEINKMVKERNSKLEEKKKALENARNYENTACQKIKQLINLI